VAVATTVGLAASGKGGKPVPNPQATVTFGNGPSDNILSDGSAYAGGAGGVVDELQSGTTPDGNWTGPTNLLLNVTAPSLKPKRYLLYKYPEAAKADLHLQASSSPYSCSYYPGSQGPTSVAAGVKVAGYMNIHSIGQMQIGEARAVRIHFGADQGQFLWLSPHNVATGSCSSTVIAYRDSQTTWHVATDIDRIPGAAGLSVANGVRLAADGVYEVRGTDVSWWDRPSAVSQLNAGPSVGNYRMPFAMTISVPTAPAPPPCTVKPCTIVY
jgi:hypothetical protein